MRPLRLSMTAFGPYAATQVIDFRSLIGHRLFLIHGPTGAGKTTILDAVCYALYGESSGDERQGAQMRSDHAGPEVVTEVTLDFALGDRGYRVRRRPDQERPKQRGTGTVRVPGEATLWRLPAGDGAAAAGSGEGEGTVLATRHNPVSDQIQQLLGFRAAEFRQVVVLPQGRFRELLVAESKDRQQILETLFQTALYARIEEVLRRRADDTRQTLTKLRDREQMLLQQAEVDSAEALRARLAELTDAITGDRLALETLRTVEGERRAALQAGRQTVERLDAVVRAEAEIKGFALRRDEQDRRTRGLARGHKALRVVPVETARDQADQDRTAAGIRAEAARTALVDAEREATAAAGALAAEEARADEREAARRRIQDLEAVAQHGGALETARQEATTRAKAARQAQAQAERLRRGHIEAQGSLTVKEAAALAAAGEAGQLEARRVLAAEAERRLRLRRDWDAGQAAQIAAGTTEAKARTQTEAAQEALNALRADLTGLEKAWLDGQAGLLAAALAPNRPCPVCGSPDHPAPAVPTAAVPERAAVEALRERVRVQGDRVDALRQQAALAGQRLEAERVRLDAVRAQLAEAADGDEAALAERLAAARRDLAAAAQAATRLDGLGIELAAMRDAERAAGLALAEAEQAGRAAETAQAAAAAVLREREGLVPAELRAPGALATALAEARSAQQRLDQALEAARGRAGRSAEVRAGAATRLDEAGTALAIAGERWAQHQAAYSRALAAAGFADAADYRAARLDDAELERLDEEIKRFDAGHRAAHLRLTDALAAATGLTAPDLPALEGALAEAAAATAAGAEAVARLDERRAALGRLLGDVEDVAGQRAEADRRYRIEGRLGAVAAGQNERKLSFQRFVLGALLDDVVTAANRRLVIMSRGRYRLRRLEDAADRRRAAGLDLEVLDGYTDKARSVKTLSGGESFLAALSLALGVVDVVQAYAGGIAIDTLFIDEGFGSLDPEALDAAIQALLDLQAGGRLIGIISHVTDLRERIDARLEVEAGRDGSTARFTSN